MKLDEVLAALRDIRIPTVSLEFDIHAKVEEAMHAARIPFRKEAKIAPRCPIDFLIDDIGIEIGKGKPNQTELELQSIPEGKCLLPHNGQFEPFLLDGRGRGSGINSDWRSNSIGGN